VGIPGPLPALAMCPSALASDMRRHVHELNALDSPRASFWAYMNPREYPSRFHRALACTGQKVQECHGTLTVLY